MSGKRIIGGGCPVINLVILLLIAAAVLLIVEAFVPDFGICGILGIVSLVVAMVITSFLPYGMYIVLAQIVFFGFFIYVLYKYFFTRRFQGKLVLDDTLELEEPDFNKKELLGKEGISTTPLKPTGFADFNGTILEVSSEGAFILEGSRIKVIDVANNRIVVRLVKEADGLVKEANAN